MFDINSNNFRERKMSFNDKYFQQILRGYGNTSLEKKIYNEWKKFKQTYFKIISHKNSSYLLSLQSFYISELLLIESYKRLNSDGGNNNENKIDTLVNYGKILAESLNSISLDIYSNDNTDLTSDHQVMVFSIFIRLVIKHLTAIDETAQNISADQYYNAILDAMNLWYESFKTSPMELIKKYYDILPNDIKYVTENCENCNGTGFVDKEDNKNKEFDECPKCKGFGFYYKDINGNTKFADEGLDKIQETINENSKELDQLRELEQIIEDEEKQDKQQIMQTPITDTKM